MKSKGKNISTKTVELPVIATSNVDWGKRAFILSVFLAPFAASSLGSFLIEYEKREKEKENQKNAHRQMISNLIFGESTRHFYTPSYNNPYAENSGITTITNPTKDALFSVFSHLGGTPENMTDLNTSGPAIIDGGLLLLGGPVPNPVSRSILGDGSGSPIFQEALSKKVRLPISFANINSIKTGPGNRPEYQVLVNDNPLPAEKGTDYLVITSMPNIYSSTYALGDRLFNIAGLHGGGTRAIDLVLQQDFLGKLYKDVTESSELRSAPAWQAIIRVELKTDNNNLPNKIIGCKTYRVKLDEDDFYKAHNHVLSNNIPINIINA